MFSKSYRAMVGKAMVFLTMFFLLQGTVVSQPSFPHSGTSVKQALSAQGQVAAATASKFDGKTLYEATFLFLRDNHIVLADPKVRAAWAAEWQNKYAGTTQLDTEEGADKACTLMVRSLKQRYDYYENVQQAAATQKLMNPSHIGIGVMLKLVDAKKILKGLPKNATAADVEKALIISEEHPLSISETIEGSPADKALQVGDRITRIDGQDLNGKTLNQALGLIKGNENVVVEVTVKRKDAQGNLQELVLKITRKKFIPRVAKYKNLGNGLHYVRLSNWMSNHTAEELAAAFQKARGARGVVIDLRGNPGGRVEMALTAIAMVQNEGAIFVQRERNGDMILEGDVVAHPQYVSCTEPDPKNVQKSRVRFQQRPALAVPVDTPVVVLVDEGSASASEMFAGALQHNHRALIVGKPTAGKGVGQKIYPLPFDRQIRVTTFEFVPGRTPNNWIGVIPDVEVEQPEDVDIDQDDRQLNAATRVLEEQIKAQQVRQAKRDKQKKFHEDEYRKELEELGN